MTDRFRLFLKLLCLPTIVYVIHITSIFVFDVYNFWPLFDAPMHFLGGVAIAGSSIILIDELRKKKYIGTLHSGLRALFVVSLTTTVAVLWEFHEFLLDTFYGVVTQVSLQDTMGDLFLGMVGAGLMVVLDAAWRAKK